MLLSARHAWQRIFTEREIFYRSHGEVRFVRISRRAQILAASIFTLLLALWAGITIAMAYRQSSVAFDQQALAVQQRNVAHQASKVDAYKRSISDITADLDRRQDMLDELVRSQFGSQSLDRAVVGQDGSKTVTGDATGGSGANPAMHKTSDALPALDKLRSLETRQHSFAQRLSALVDQRAQRAEAAIRSFGINPQQILRSHGAQGGPYIPWSQDLDEADRAFTDLAASLARLNALERGLAAMPSGRPTMSPSLTSSYGYRRDPFTRAAAFHAGLDFPGRYGQPILAAANGRISFVGQRSGYGNCIDVDHGNGIITRYAHLSGYTVRAGQQVVRGAQIARMGSTGRSTGTHLHFEVRVNGAPINPRRFLEAKQDVLQIQQIAHRRVVQVLA